MMKGKHHKKNIKKNMLGFNTTFDNLLYSQAVPLCTKAAISEL